MLLTITTTHEPATDLGYLLYKNPARAQSFTLSFGAAHFFYPEAAPERCTAALLLDVDPVGLVRGTKAAGAPLEQYVNDRPYVASSFLSVAIAQVFGSALSGRSKERQELAETPIPLEARISALPCRGGEDLLRRLCGACTSAYSAYWRWRASGWIRVSDEYRRRKRTRKASRHGRSTLRAMDRRLVLLVCRRVKRGPPGPESTWFQKEQDHGASS